VPSPDPVFKYSNGFPSNSKIEVMHTCCDDIRNGFWMYLAIGSGISIDLGNTMVFADHQAALSALGLDAWNTEDFSQMVIKARERGWDTIQFTHRCEGTYKYEVLDVRTTSMPTATGPCPTSSAKYHSGWKGLLESPGV